MGLFACVGKARLKAPRLAVFEAARELHFPAVGGAGMVGLQVLTVVRVLCFPVVGEVAKMGP